MEGRRAAGFSSQTAWPDAPCWPKAHLDSPRAPSKAMNQRHLDSPRRRPWTSFEVEYEPQKSPRMVLDMPPMLSVDLYHYTKRTAAKDLDPEMEWKHPTWAAVLGDDAKEELCATLAGSPRGQAGGAAPAGSPDVSGSQFWQKIEDHQVRMQHHTLSPRGDKAAHYLVEFRHTRDALKRAQERRKQLELDLRKPERPQVDQVPCLSNYTPYSKPLAYYDHLRDRYLKEGVFNLRGKGHPEIAGARLLVEPRVYREQRSRHWMGKTLSPDQKYVRPLAG